jgi:hypothetical protein
MASLWAISHCFGVLGDLHGPWHSVHVWEAWPKTRSFCILGLFLWAIAHCFGVMGGDLHGPWHSVHVWEAWPKTCRFYIFGPFSLTIVHNFGFLGWFSGPMTLRTCLTGMTKNSSFLRFRIIFVSYCPLFGGYGGIYMTHDTQYMFERHDQKLVVFTFFGPFSWAIVHNFGFLGWFSSPMTLGTYLTGMTKN